jgi:hypothetical protein
MHPDGSDELHHCDVALPERRVTYALCPLRGAAVPPRSSATTYPGNSAEPPLAISLAPTAGVAPLRRPFQRRRSASPERLFLHSIRSHGFMTR